MAAPSFIQEAETAWNSGTTPKTTASFNVLAGDVLVAVAIVENNDRSLSAVTGGSLTWTERQRVAVTDYCQVAVSTATVDSDKSMTVSFAASAGSAYFGGNVFTFRGSDGVGASSKTNASGAPSLGLTTTQVDSAIVVANGDWSTVDGTVRAWETVSAGVATEQTYFRDAAHYGVYAAYHADAGTAAAKTVGLTLPTGQKYSIVAVEVKGSGGSAVGIPALVMAPRIAR